VTTSRLLPSNTTSDQPPLPTNTPRWLIYSFASPLGVLVW